MKADNMPGVILGEGKISLCPSVVHGFMTDNGYYYNVLSDGSWQKWNEREKKWEMWLCSIGEKNDAEDEPCSK